MTASYDRERELCALRGAHREAIRNFDYRGAESIQRDIDAARAYDPDAGMRARAMAVQCRNTRAQFGVERRSAAAANRDIIARFSRRFAAMQALHDGQLESLRAEHARALARERSRPIPEVDHQLLRSQVFARDHQYARAERTLAGAAAHRDELVRARARACVAAFREQRDQLLICQGNDLVVLKEAIDNALSCARNRHTASEVVIGRRLRVKEFKAGVWPPERYTLGRFSNGTPRRERPRGRRVRRCNPRLDPTGAFQV